MSGYNCLWVPGTDHAGIATQTVVEKKIMRERKQTRHDVGEHAALLQALSSGPGRMRIRCVCDWVVRACR